MERDDLRRRTPHARKIRQVAHDRRRALALSLDAFLRLVELSAIAAHQHKHAVFGQLERRPATDPGGRPGDDVRLAS
jgi:hypothetical protein